MMKRPGRPGILSRPKPVTMPVSTEPDPAQTAFEAQTASMTSPQWAKVMDGLKAYMDKQAG